MQSLFQLYLSCLDTAEFQTAGVTISRAVCCAGRPDGPGHRNSRRQHPAGPQGPRRHQHRPGRGDVHLPHLRRGMITLPAATFHQALHEGWVPIHALRPSKCAVEERVGHMDCANSQEVEGHFKWLL